MDKKAKEKGIRIDKEDGKKVNKKAVKNKKEVNKKIKYKKEQKKEKKSLYIGYSIRVFIYCILFLLLLFFSLMLVYKSIGVDEEKSVTYQESGNIDYRVYLKQNEFYSLPYLTSGNTVIARLIDKIEINAAYSFAIQEETNIDYNYELVAKLTIDNSDKKRLFEKEYTLVSNKTEKLTNSTGFNINETVNIDYNYYNNLANEFRSTFGVETVSNLYIYLRTGKSVANNSKTISLNNSQDMSLSMPLTERTVDISTSNIPMINSSIILAEKKTGFKNISFVVIAVILFITSVSMLLKTLELLFLLFKNDSKYDKFINKILKEYDRLIVETETAPNLTDNNLIKIKKFQELLDVRDNLKRPIMYYIVSNHQKSYFYVQNENNYYLLVVKAIDLENKK